MKSALDGVTVIALATNIPGPIAAARLAAMGARVRKFEPVGGDPLADSAPQWYRDLTNGVTVERRDLRVPAERAVLHEALLDADLLVTTLRAPALERLGLTWERVHDAVPRLSHVALFGEAPPNDGRAGHDLTYQARAGYVGPPALPRTLFADMAAAERAVSAALEALAFAARHGEGTRRDVAIVDAAQAFAAPIRYGLTTPGGPLGGALPGYNIYRAADGWLAVALLEKHFIDAFESATQPCVHDRSALERVIASKSVAQWEALAREHDLPICGVE